MKMLAVGGTLNTMPELGAGVWYGCYDDEQADAAYTMCSDRYLTDRSSKEV